jgi:hypothetical protein
MDKENMQKRKDSGALWVRTSKQGNKFLSGNLTTSSGEPVKFVIFKNSYKTEGSSQPDYRIYLEEATPTSTAEVKTAKTKLPEVESSAVPAEEDIAF